MIATFHPVSAEQKTNNDILRQGVVGVKCLFVGSPSDPESPEFTDEQLQALGSVDNIMLELGVTKLLSNMEVYENGAINFFVKDTSTRGVIGYVTVRQSEDEYIDQQAREHGAD